MSNVDFKCQVCNTSLRAENTVNNIFQCTICSTLYAVAKPNHVIRVWFFKPCRLQPDSSDLAEWISLFQEKWILRLAEVAKVSSAKKYKGDTLKISQEIIRALKQRGDLDLLRVFIKFEGFESNEAKIRAFAQILDAAFDLSRIESLVFGYESWFGNVENYGHRKNEVIQGILNTANSRRKLDELARIMIEEHPHTKMYFNKYLPEYLSL